MRTKKEKCDRCANAWRVVVDEETGDTRLHGCMLPKRHKFSKRQGWADEPCKDFVGFAGEPKRLCDYEEGGGCYYGCEYNCMCMSCGIIACLADGSKVCHECGSPISRS